MSKQFCYFFFIRPERIEEYEAEHHNIWPEMVPMLKGHGMVNYTLFRKDEMVVAVGEVTDDVAETFAGMEADPLNQEWSKHIRSMMSKFSDDEGKLLFADRFWGF